MTTTTRPPVDAETLVVAYLEDLDAAILGGPGPTPPTIPVSTKLHRDFKAGDRAIRLTRIGGLPLAGSRGYVDRARIQVDVFGADEADAAEVAGRALAALQDLPESDFVFSKAVVTAVVQDLGLASVPDPDTGADRYLFGVVLYLHPAGS